MIAGHRLGDRARLPDDVDVPAQLRPDPGAEHRVVVNQEHPQPSLSAPSVAAVSVRWSVMAAISSFPCSTGPRHRQNQPDLGALAWRDCGSPHVHHASSSGR